jgi:hybrid cluster-associated redox disulfide protein
MQQALFDMTVSDIMRRWPMTLSVFLDFRMLCIGCPIGIFHTPADVAEEHGIALELLLAELNSAIAGDRVRRGRTGDLPRSRKAGAAPGQAASGGRLPRAPRVPRR